jgi:hypothetical protein
MDAANRVTGSMKWDAASITDTVPGSEGLPANSASTVPLLIVAGSTAEDEEAMPTPPALPASSSQCPANPSTSGAAAALPGCARCSIRPPDVRQATPSSNAFLDTIGELARSPTSSSWAAVRNLYGSDPIEPVALESHHHRPSIADFPAIPLSAAGLASVMEELAKTLDKLLADAAQRGQSPLPDVPASAHAKVPVLTTRLGHGPRRNATRMS